MEPDQLCHLQNGPESFSLTPIKSESEPTPETVVFKKRRDTFHVVYISDTIWTLDRKLIEDDFSDKLRPVLMATVGMESLKNSDLSFCYVLQWDRESGWWIMWLAVSSQGDSESGEEVELTLLCPHSKTKAAFWIEGMHCYVLSGWDHCLMGDSETAFNLPWLSHANIITELSKDKSE